MKRRKFILCLAGTAAAGLTGWQLSGKSRTGPLVKVSRKGFALGTQVSLTTFHTDARQAEAAIEAAFKELDLVEDIMSLYRPESQLSQLNRTGRLENPHPYLVEVLEESIALSKATEGAFDVTIQPLWKAYFEHSGKGSQPTEGEIKASLASIGWEKIEITPDLIHLTGPNQAVTLNGIAQGFAADRVAEVFSAHGVDSALIDTGEFGAIGSHAEKDSWTIGIKHPRNQQELLGVASLKGQCLATSGDYETTFSDDFSQHHLLDPKTGRSPAGLSSVTVIAATATQADALSTAAFLVGMEKGKALIETKPDTEALFVTKDGTTVKTAGFPAIG
jgi:thiamine biosynthesis lipoprotein